MRGEFGVEGSKDPNKLTKLMGIIGGAGMDGKHVFDNYLSAGGLYQGHKYRSRQSEWNELPGLETEARALAAASKEEHTKFTAEELVTATADLQNLEKTIKNIDTNLGLGDDAKVDFGTETGQGIGLSIIANLQSELEQLQGLDNTAEASAVQGQITLLQSAMASKATQTKRELSNLTGAAATPEQDAQRKTANEKMIDEGLAGRRSTLQSEADGIRRGMDATGVAVSFDAAGNITVAGGEVTTKEKKNDAAEAANKARSNVNRLYREKGALMPGQSYEARVEKNRLVGEEMNKIKDILNTEELRGYMARAIEQKNRYMEKACRDRIMQLGDGNELLQDGTAHLWTPEMAGQPSEAGRSDAAGLHFYREHYLQGIMGMSEGEAMQEMNDSSYIGEGIGHLGIGRAFTMRAGRIRQLSESERAATCAGEKLKSSPSTWLDGNRLFVGYEDRNRDFHMSGHGITLLRQAGSALEADRLWERWNSNIKGKLSQPHIIDQLKREGIDAKLIIRLQKYYQQVGRFEGSDAPRRAGASRLARMAA